MHKITEAIREELIRRGKPEISEKTRRYFREPITTHGCTSSDVKSVTTQFNPLLRKDLNLTITVTGELMQGGVADENWVASNLLAKHKSRIKPVHFEIFDAWIDHLTNWASIDIFTTGVVYLAIKGDPRLVDRLLQWTTSNNRWRRRAAAVTLVPIARRGDLLQEAFAVADRLMEDRDDMVQKGAGWLLKEASKKHPNEVREYLLRWRERASALTLRYASEKLPAEKRVLKTRF